MSSSPAERESSSAAARNLILRAWRERWSDVQFAVRVKPVFRAAEAEARAAAGPSAAGRPGAGDYPGDALDLSRLLLDHALVGPSPNRLLVGYLRHCLLARVVSRPAVLRALAAFDRWDRPHCTAALLELASYLAGSLNMVRDVEDPFSFSVAVLHLLAWLIRLVVHSHEALEKAKGAPDADSIEAKNHREALKWSRFLLDSEHVQAMLYVGKEEDKDAWKKVVSGCKLLSDQVKQQNVGRVPDAASLKAEAAKLIHSIRSLDPSRSILGAKGHAFSSNVIQPALTCEALFRSTADLTELSLFLHSVALSHGLSFSDLAFQVLRSLLGSLSRKTDIWALKLDAFVLLRLPTLFDKLASLMRVETGSALKAPTEAYKAFDKLMRDEAILDEIDARCECNIVDTLLKVLGKCSPALLTETELVDVSNRRKDRKTAQKVLPQDMGVPTRNFDTTLKAETLVDNALNTFNQDMSKPDNLEALLGVLCLMVTEESFDRLLAASSANGRLKLFVRRLIKFNQQSQESQGESVKNSLLRATLFDITFLMLHHVANCFGGDVVLREAEPGSLVETWVRDMMLEGGKVKPMSLASSQDEAMADLLLQQLHKGELRTQVVRWQNSCFSMHLALREMICARAAGTLEADRYGQMVRTASSKLCALPVCALSWLLSHRTLALLPIRNSDAKKALPPWSDVGELTDEFLRLVAEGREEVAEVTDMPHAKERTALMHLIMEEMQEQSGRKKPVFRYDLLSEALSEDTTNASLTDGLAKVWSHATQLGRLDGEATRVAHRLYSAGGATWLVSALVERLMAVAHEDDLRRQTDLLCGLLAGMDLSACAQTLLQDILPAKYLLASAPNGGYGSQGKGSVDGASRLADPHGSALAKLVVFCIYGVLVPHHVAEKAGMKPSISGMKRGFSEMDGATEQPGTKMRRILGDGDNSTAFSVKPDPDEDSSAVATAVHPLSHTLAAFFRLLNSVLVAAPATPRLAFAVRLLEQVVRQGRSHTRTLLVLQHLSVSTVLRLVKAVPELFSVGLVTQLFDCSSSEGRISTSRVLCALNKAKTRKEAEHETTNNFPRLAVESSKKG